MNAGCLDEGRVLAFLEGTLSDDGRSEVEAHLAACSACAELTTWAAADQAHRSRVPGEEGRSFVGHLPPGARVDRYQILGGVGRGGMGEVYAAYHPDLDRRIALKVVSESGGNAPERRARLLREARAIARLSHPNVVAVYDAGTVDDRVYIAMEFVAGETVDAWLRAKPRGWREILDVFIAAGRGLAAAHAAGIVHRDFKPQNVMIGHDGSVRVMDFGLARLALEPADVTEAAADTDSRPLPATVTKTGALIGTPAYMSPEQFRGETLDARSDQFSFCVALYEALHGSRPVLAHVHAAASGETDRARRLASVPGWLRTTVSRGLAARREERFPAMADMIRTLERGQTRRRRRALTAGAALAVALVAFGGWRAARGGHISCEVPATRLDLVWSGHDDARRQAIQRIFATNGRPTAETSWQRVARALDEYISRWSAMYVDICKATHVRGEQSAEVLDLRMNCLSENLDEVRALTDVLAAGNATTTNATIAVQDLPLLSRCDDLVTLRSAIPPPRDPRIAQEVRELRRLINDVNALDEVGNRRAALEKATALRPRVEATLYRPLLGEFLAVLGGVVCDIDPLRGESLLEEAVLAANASRDDVTAAVAASALAFTFGYKLARPKDGHLWARLANASLDRTGAPHARIRSWILHNDGSVHAEEGHFDVALELVQQATTLKEGLLGKDHPDVARSLTTLCLIAIESGRPAEGLPWCNRAIDIVRAIDPDSILLASASTNRGEVLTALGRHPEAATDFQDALRILRIHHDSSHQLLAHPLQGLGEVKIAAGDSAGATLFLEEALRIREQREPQPLLVADTRFALARALWERTAARPRARTLATAAQRTYATQSRTKKEQAVATWLAAHSLAR
jgi:eukaryotic-like serine/threonine-protein kinase